MYVVYRVRKIITISRRNSRIFTARCTVRGIAIVSHPSVGPSVTFRYHGQNWSSVPYLPLGHAPLSTAKNLAYGKNATLEKLTQLFCMFLYYIHYPQESNTIVLLYISWRRGSHRQSFEYANIHKIVYRTLKMWWIFSDHYCKFTTEYASERILKTAVILTKL